MSSRRREDRKARVLSSVCSSVLFFFSTDEKEKVFLVVRVVLFHSCSSQERRNTFINDQHEETTRIERSFYLTKIECEEDQIFALKSVLMARERNVSFLFRCFRMPQRQLKIEESSSSGKRRRTTDEEEEENPDREADTTLDNGQSTFNGYATKKTLANSSFELALLVTNAVQLKTLLGNKGTHDTLWHVGLTLVCVSIGIQVLNACILVLWDKGNSGKEKRQHRLD